MQGIDIETIKELMKQDINKYPGYILDDNGDVQYVNPMEHKEPLEELERIANNLKDGRKFAKAVKYFNDMYSNIFASNVMHEFAENELDFKMNIYLPLIDVFFVYDAIKDNPIFTKGIKNTKLKVNRIDPKTAYVEKAAYIELGLKKYNKLDDETKRLIVITAGNTLIDYSRLENKDISNRDFLIETAKLNGLPTDDETLRNLEKVIRMAGDNKL